MSTNRELISVNGLTLNVSRREVTTKQGRHHLRPQEARLLEVFMRNAGQILSRRFLMKEVWETDFVGDTRTLEVHVCWLRKKLEDNPRQPRYLSTVRGVGYQFLLPEGC